MLSCPSCRCEMRVCVERGIELDICDNCHGVWLDAGELTKLAEIEESRCFPWAIPTNQQCPLTTVQCPRCPDTLLVKVLIECQAFQSCRICNGLFIDSETLDSIISMEDNEEQSTTMDFVSMGLLDALATIIPGCPIILFDKSRQPTEHGINERSNND